jgi:hypothetical protein
MNIRRHPSSYTDAELRNMLRDQRLALTRRVIALEHEIRERVAELYAAEGRLADIDEANELLSKGSTNHRDGKLRIEPSR